MRAWPAETGRTCSRNTSAAFIDENGTAGAKLTLSGPGRDRI